MRVPKSFASGMPLVTELEWINNWCQILVFLPRDWKFSTGLLALFTETPCVLLILFTRKGPCSLSIQIHSSHALWHPARCKRIGTKFLYCTHSTKMTVSIISQWEFSFNMTYTLTDMKEANRISKPIPMYAFNLIGRKLDPLDDFLPAVWFVEVFFV